MQKTATDLMYYQKTHENEVQTTQKAHNNKEKILEDKTDLGCKCGHTLFINPSSITELLMLLNNSNNASTSLTLTEEQKFNRMKNLN